MQLHLANDDLLRPEDTNHQRRQVYTSTDNLVFMRLIALVYAQSFGIPLIRCAIQKESGAMELPLPITVWTTVRRYFFSRLIDKIKRKIISWPEPKDGRTQSFTEIFHELREINHLVIEHLDRYTPDALWTSSPPYTEFDEFRQKVLKSS
jgi:hypothetical protein